MTAYNRLAVISAEIALDSDAVQLALRDRRPDALALFQNLPEESRDELAGEAWIIGLRALQNAEAEAQAARLKDIGRALQEDLDRGLKVQLEQQQAAMKRALAEYFDPRDGKLSERMNAFLQDEGVLAKALEKYVAPERSVLAEALARQVGENSPLFKKLSPTDSEGLVHLLASKLETVLGEHKAGFTRALDPLEKDGAVGRFLRSLREELQTADGERAEQLKKALAALDANDESSLLNRLVRESQAAKDSLLRAINPSLPDSPMAVLKTALEGLLKEHAEAQADALEASRQRQETFEKDVRETLARLETRREQDLKTTQGGHGFQEEVSRFIHEAAQGSHCLVEDTGGKTGAKQGCKVGDVVLRFTEESAFHGSALVVEAKRDSSYNLVRALDELETARVNRKAECAVFVMAASHAPVTFPRFARYGKDVLVIWDPEDGRTDPYLHAAILAGLSLATRKRTNADDGDIQALEGVAQRIEAEINRLGKMGSSNEKIRRASDEIADEIRKGEKKLGLLLQKSQDVLKALNVEIADEAAERESPISLPSGLSWHRH